MPISTITTLPPAPIRSQAESNFVTISDTFVAALGPFVTEMNNAIAGINSTVATINSQAATVNTQNSQAAASASAAQNYATQAAASAVAAAASSGSAAGFTATSATTGVSIGTGSKSLTIQASKSFQANEFVIASDQANGANYIAGQITSYNNGSGLMVINVTATGGTGTPTNWNVSLSGPVGATGSGFVGGTLTGPINDAPRQDIASAATTNIAGSTSNYIRVTGTTTITALGSIASGAEREVEFQGILTLTHNATSLILPGGLNITTAAGDIARFRSLGSGNWKCTSYTSAATSPGGYRPGDYVFSHQTAPPPGFLAPDGSLVSTTTYSGLYAVVGQSYGQFSSQSSRTFTAPTNVQGASGTQLMSTVLTGDRLALLISCNTGGGSTYYDVLLTSTDGSAITVPAGNGTGISNGSIGNRDAVVALGAQHLWVFNTTGLSLQPLKSTDAWATTPSTVTLSSFPTGASITTIRSAAGNTASGKLIVGGAKGSSLPFVAAVNTSTGALTEKTLTGGSGTLIKFLVSNNAGVWLAMSDAGVLWRSADDGETWAVQALPVSFSAAYARVSFLGGRFVIHYSSAVPSWFRASTCQFASSVDGVTWKVPVIQLPVWTSTSGVSDSGYIYYLTYIPSANTYVMAVQIYPNGGVQSFTSADLVTFVSVGTGVLPTSAALVAAVGKFLLQGAGFGSGANASFVYYWGFTHDVSTQFRLPNFAGSGLYPLLPYVRAI